MASFEQRAFEGLGNALKAMGYTGESLMKSFDMDGDSVLNYEEFKAGIAKTTSVCKLIAMPKFHDEASGFGQASAH